MRCVSDSYCAPVGQIIRALKLDPHRESLQTDRPRLRDTRMPGARLKGHVLHDAAVRRMSTCAETRCSATSRKNGCPCGSRVAGEELIDERSAELAGGN